MLAKLRAKLQYGELRNYGMNYIIKERARFPKYLPLPCYYDHGWSALAEAVDEDLINDKPFAMVWNKRMAKSWKQQSDQPVYIMGSPFVHYKNSHHLKKKKNAKGTVAYPVHSTFCLKGQFDVDKYCQDLKKLPKEFHPITICLFWLDYTDPSADIYKKYGFKVVTAGYKLSNSLSFVKNFYDILSSHQYATSNEVGTHAFYAFDFGTPFFLTGDPPVIYNDPANKYDTLKEYTFIKEMPFGKITRKMFATGPVKKISVKQRQFVVDELGIKDCISSKEMNKLFWHYYRKNHYWLKAFVPYLFTTLWAFLVFNMPWMKLLMRLRKKYKKMRIA